MRKKIAAAALLLAGAAATGPAVPGDSRATGPPPLPAAMTPGVAKFLAQATLEPGDIVFRRAPGLWGDMAAAFSTRERRFSHAGIVVRQGGAILIVHAAGDPTARSGRVIAEPVASFFAGVADAAAYRLRQPRATRARIAAAAGRYAREARPFDTEFSLVDAAALYCTELVWRAVREGADLDIAPRRIAMGRAYIAADDLYLNRFVAEVGNRAARPPSIRSGSSAR